MFGKAIEKIVEVVDYKPSHCVREESKPPHRDHLYRIDCIGGQVTCEAREFRIRGLELPVGRTLPVCAREVLASQAVAAATSEV